MRAIVAHAMIALTAATLTAPCAALNAPVDAPIVRDYEPIGNYAGHWGIDYGVAVGTDVRAAGPGRVTFAGSVAGVLSVTIDHGGGLKTSYSYLTEIGVGVREWVGTGSRLGTSGVHHGVAALHFSTRIDGVYQDPVRWLRCGGSIPDALWLSPAYSLGRATWHPGRNLRSAALRASIHGRSRLLAAEPRRRHIHAGRSTLAEGGSGRR